MILTKVAIVAGRALMAGLFILAGAAKMAGPAPFLVHMDQFKIPRWLLPAVIALEVGGGMGLLIGWRLPLFAGAMAAFCLATALVFHRNLGDRFERAQFFKDLAVAGALAVIGAGAVPA